MASGSIRHPLQRAVAASAGIRRAIDADRLGAMAAVAALGLFGHAVLHDAPGDTAGKHAAGQIESRASVVGGPERFHGFYGGTPFTHPSNVRFLRDGATDLTVQDVAWEGKPFKSPIYYGLRSISWGGGGQGTMLDFTHSKTISNREQQVRLTGQRNGAAISATAKVGDTFKHLEFSHGHNMLTLNRVARLSPLSALLQPYVGGGIGVALPHTEIQFADEARRTYEYQYAGPVGQALAGLEIRLATVSLFIEYKFTLARYEVPLSGRDSRGWGLGDFPAHLSAWLGGRAPEYGYARTTLASHQVIGGIGVRTGAAAPTAQGPSP